MYINCILSDSNLQKTKGQNRGVAQTMIIEEKLFISFYKLKSSKFIRDHKI